MQQYKKYLTEDFVLDALFQQWVRKPTQEMNDQWNEYLEKNPDQSQSIENARLLLSSVYARFSSAISNEEIDDEISNLLNKIKLKTPIPEEPIYKPFLSSSFLTKWAVAASVLLAIAATAWYLNKSSGTEPSFPFSNSGNSEIVSRVNLTEVNQTFLLQDSTIVVLSPQSELQISGQFGNQKREVFLSGEAFFEVRRNVDQPFLVYSQNLVTRVLGTSFLVKAIKNGSEEIVEVKKGKVSVFKKEDFKEFGTGYESQGLLVTTNQKVTLEIRDKRLVKTLSALPEMVAKKPGASKQGYVNTPASQVLKELSEAYQVDVVFDEELLAGCPITAVLNEQSLKEKLDIICEVIEAKYEILDGKIMVFGRSCK